jgi:hypothetical protein
MTEGEGAVAPDDQMAEPDPLAALDASVRRGVADAEAGRTKPEAPMFDRLEEKYWTWPVTKSDHEDLPCPGSL